LLGEESQNTHHGQSSVVEFLDESGSLRFCASALGEAKGVEEVQWDWVWDPFRVVTEVGEFTRSSSLHVVGAGALGEELQESDEGDDLDLSHERESIPLLRRGQHGRVAITGKVNWEWEVESGGLDDVSDKGSHGNTAMLDLGVTDEVNGLLVAESVEFKSKEIHRIPELEDRVGLGGNLLEFSLGAVESSLGKNIASSAGESSSGAGEKGESEQLHLQGYNVVTDPS